MDLPISRLINVDVVLAPAAAQAQDLSTLLILGSSAVIDVEQRLRTYSSIEAVAADFGTSAPEYLAAILWFAQAPQPNFLKIGRWAEANTPGQLIGAPLATANLSIAAWTSINNGTFDISIDGSPQSLTGLNFSAQTNLNGVASVINGALSGATCVYNSTYRRFEFTSATSGVGSTVSFLTPEGTGTDISGMLAGLSSDSGAYVADGIDAETPVEAVAAFDAQFGQTWYATMFADVSLTNDQHLEVGAYIEASNNKHLYGVTTQEGGVLSSVSTNDIAYLMSQANYNRSIVQYSSTNPYAVASLFGRALTVNYNGNSTVITLMYKQQPLITAERLSETQITALEDKNCNVFVAYNNDTAIVERGQVASGNFIDEMTGTDWLAVTIMTAVYNLLYTSPTKIPQTDAGTHLLVTTCEAVCSQGVTNGLLAPGVWNSAGFGNLQQGGFLAAGFYVYAPPVATQLQADREARRSVPIQIAAKLAGAVHTVDIIINVNR